MDFYSDLADADVVGDLLVESAGHHQGHHLTLTRGERLETLPQRSDCLFVLQPRAITRQPQLDRVQQVLIAERLGQELDRSPFIARTDIGMSPYPVMKMIGT